MGGGPAGAGGRAARALRLLLLLVMALAAVEYLFGSMLDASPIKTYLYTPIYNATPTFRSRDKTSSTEKPLEPNFNTTHSNTNKTLQTINKTEAVTRKENVTRNPLDTTPVLISKIMEGIKNLVGTEDSRRNDSYPLCEAMPAELGPVQVNKSEMLLSDVEKNYPEVYWGGWYSPPNCTARHKVAVIVPYRDREEHLAIFLNHMHPFLMKQQLEYGIFIVEQNGQSQFNRAKLFNVGFKESSRLKSGGWECFVFHDVDLLPLDGRNIYSCPRQPRHMSASIDKHRFKLLYEDLFGGVSAMTYDQFSKVNGFSNKYWGWGGEDDDMATRLKKKNYHIARYKMSVARYTMLDHKQAVANPKRYQLLSQSKMFEKDGLSTLNYEVVKVTQHHLYTHILVNIEEKS